jgi:PAS domain S-box-containing protein
MAAVACLRIDLYMTLGLTARAVEVCLTYLRYLGIELSPHPTEAEARREYERISTLLGGRGIEELIDLPLMSELESVATLDVLMKALTPAMLTDANLLSLLICRMVNLSTEYGNTDSSCYAYAWLGVVAGPRFGDYQSGFRFGQLGHDLVKSKGLKRFESRTYLCFAVFILSWTKNLQTARDVIRQAFHSANVVGDLRNAAYAYVNLLGNLLGAGDPLPEVEREAEQGLELARKARFRLMIECITTQLAFAHTLRGSTATFGHFDGARLNEREYEQRLSSDSSLAVAECWYWIRKLQARFFAGDYPAAVKASENAQRLLWTSPSFYETAEAHFYGALSRARSCDAESSEYQRHREAVAAHHQQLMGWAANCPQIFQNRAALVAAEVARVEGRDLDAERLYEAAIHSARENGFVHHEGLAHELAAQYYLARGIETASHAYLRNARDCYDRWGAHGKVKQLDERYPRLREQGAVASSPAMQLDVETVVKASQAISSEMVLPELIEKLVRIAVEHAGAERGLLILLRGGEPRIEAEATTGPGWIDVAVRQATIAPYHLPHSALHYVIRTQESVLLDNASADPVYSKDEYVRRKRSRSILCLPIVKQAKLVGALYLENNLTPCAFTQERVTVLQLLASQAAISLENASLYSGAKKAEEKIRQSEKEARQLLNLSPLHITELGPDGERLYTNRASLDYYGITLEEWREIDLQRLFHPQEAGLLANDIPRKFRSGSPFECEVRGKRKDGQYRWFHCRFSPMSDEQGRITRWYGAATDIEDLKLAEQRLQEENVALREEIDKASMFEEIVGGSAPLKKILSRISRVAPTDSSVLITGETGTGKELVARAIHRRSRRSSYAFVSVNCAVIPRDLVASELFGHEKGAFTGATQRRLGRFELAEKGTIFLDEVGELAAETQIALLRVLQEREFERIGGTGSVRADVRVIAATNRDLESEIDAGRFRSDLYYRLNVFPMEMPTLRERSEDIPLLVRYFLNRYARKAGRHFTAVDKKSLDLLQSYSWPGNIRELQNVIERSVIVSESETFSVDESWLSQQRLSRAPGLPNMPPGVFNRRPAEEKALIEAALRECGGRVSGPSGAAARLGVPGSTLESKIKALKINKDRFKRPDPSKSS